MSVLNVAQKHVKIAIIHHDHIYVVDCVVTIVPDQQFVVS